MNKLTKRKDFQSQSKIVPLRSGLHRITRSKNQTTITSNTGQDCLMTLPHDDTDITQTIGASVSELPLSVQLCVRPSVRAWSSVKSLACLFQHVSKLSRVSAVIYHLRHVRERMSDLRRQQRLERRRQRYRERRGAETPAEKERRLQNKRARRRQRLIAATAYLT